MRTPIVATLMLIPLVACAEAETGSSARNGAPATQPMTATQPLAPGLAVATFAGGCFWCMEPPFEKLDGVVEVLAGYTGGDEPNPTYEQVSSGRTGHAESIQVRYDPTRVSYETLLKVYWRQIDPTDAGGQFADRGRQYRTAIFYHDDTQRRLAEASKAELAASGRFKDPIVTAIVPAGPFYPAEDYHQDFYKKDPVRYHAYRIASGRDAFLKRVWGSEPLVIAPVTAKPSDEELRHRLTPLQYEVTQRSGTEPPFHNAYWNQHEPGIYVDVVSGEPLFSSRDKFDSGTGWPSFTRPLVPGNIVERSDSTLGRSRTEVRSKHADSHLGHVFSDGPPPTGLRYCINSAALRFVPRADLVEQGYGEFLAQVDGGEAK